MRTGWTGWSRWGKASCSRRSCCSCESTKAYTPSRTYTSGRTRSACISSRTTCSREGHSAGGPDRADRSVWACGSSCACRRVKSSGPHGTCAAPCSNISVRPRRTCGSSIACDPRKSHESRAARGSSDSSDSGDSGGQRQSLRTCHSSSTRLSGASGQSSRSRTTCRCSRDVAKRWSAVRRRPWRIRYIHYTLGETVIIYSIRRTRSCGSWKNSHVDVPIGRILNWVE